jgi:cytochrome c556
MMIKSLNRVFSLGITIGITGLVLALATGAQAEVKKKERDALVEYRSLFMKIKNDHNVAIRKLTKRMPISATERVNQMVTHANALKKMATDMMRLFPPGSGHGSSRAMKDVWDTKNNALSRQFVAKSVTMQTEAEALALVAYKGDMKEIKKQVRKLAKSCQSCHADFREE